MNDQFSDTVSHFNTCIDILLLGAADMYTGRPLTVPMSVPMPNGIGAPPTIEAFAGSLMKMPPPQNEYRGKCIPIELCYCNMNTVWR